MNCKVLLLVVLLVFVRGIHALDDSMDDLYLLRYYQAPVAELLWEIAVFTRDGTPYIQGRDYFGTTFKRDMDRNDFRTFENRISALNLDRFSSEQPEHMGESFYRLYYVKNGIRKGFVCNDSRPATGSDLQLHVAIRIIKNYARLYIPDR
ncbi:MAG: hypothetical protein ACOC2H_00150 [Spirochaetota bacterium]